MASLQISFIFPVLRNFVGDLGTRKCYLGGTILPPIRVHSLRSRNKRLRSRNGCRMSAERWYFSASGLERDGAPTRKEKTGGLVVVRANRGFGFNGDGGGGWDKNSTARVLGNLAVAVGLTYLSMTGQLGWILDAIVSIWLLALLLPVVGLGAFLWFAGRDIVQDSCPNCGNDFQILKSSLKDGVQLCPFCTQPFSVQDNKFVRESARFSSNRSTPFGQVFNGFSSRSEKGRGSSTAVVDIEAEVKDID